MFNKNDFLLRYAIRLLERVCSILSCHSSTLFLVCKGIYHALPYLTKHTLFKKSILFFPTIVFILKYMVSWCIHHQDQHRCLFLLSWTSQSASRKLPISSTPLTYSQRVHEWCGNPFLRFWSFTDVFLHFRALERSGMPANPHDL